MEREKLPLNILIRNGILFGVFFAVIMALFDFFNHKPFSVKQFIFYAISYGFFMSLAFRYKYTKKKED
ncbi:hypothetical protein [Winogradskyella sp. SYSU M77433]|uniref:hypothetical protein n=1 Tax=Winogradskyella sp. SYSU M77433 TaxID=3042722 RepID=UPI002480E035|nr:hypothetical protein [Winogradskyella sp. SYSU M77433]MDH7912581.1 hypothetical protein [Winogradskyella sp. SYSU M77433]|tara:strand:- start:165 stop:368 length:204 start_codon:yes stop_codon:yes gene_type:complete